MWYLFLQIWVWLVVAFIFGWFAHWYFCCRNKDQSKASKSSSLFGRSINTINEVTAVNTSVAGGILIEKNGKPQGFADFPEQTDDLKTIKGIGAGIEKTLNELGIYQFTQIADWNKDNVAWVDSFLSFPGRIDRENWIVQAKTLSANGTT